MRIGIDIDDVLYRTSEMIRHQAPSVLRAMGLSDTLNENLYDLCGRCNLPAERRHEIDSKLNWISLEFLSAPAICALKTLKRTDPDVDFHIVTWRPEWDTLPILQLIRQYFYLNISDYHCLAEGTSKADFCKANNIRIMLDDNADVIRGFENCDASCGILVSPEHVLHNKSFASNYDLVLGDWNDLHDLYKTVCSRMESAA